MDDIATVHRVTDQCSHGEVARDDRCEPTQQEEDSSNAIANLGCSSSALPFVVSVADFVAASLVEMECRMLIPSRPISRSGRSRSDDPRRTTSPSLPPRQAVPPGRPPLIGEITQIRDIDRAAHCSSPVLGIDRIDGPCRAKHEGPPRAVGSFTSHCGCCRHPHMTRVGRSCR